MAIYSHRQPGMVMLLAFGAAIAFVALPTLSTGGPVHPLLVVVLAILLLCLAGFWALTVEVTRQNVRVRFGFVPLWKRFAVADIIGATAVRNPWYYGWGIRLTPRGWLFNVSGLDAVELAMRNGKTYRIGTDEPDKLAAAINQVAGG